MRCRARGSRRGSGWAYSNTNYVLLGMMVERVSGQPFATLLAPAAAGSAGHGRHRRAAQQGRAVPDGALMGISLRHLRRHVASAHDLLRWGDALYGGRVLSARAWPTCSTSAPWVPGHVYGIGAERIKVGDATGYGHSGLLRGFTSLMVHLPTGT